MSTNKINIEAVNARAREEQTPMTKEITVFICTDETTRQEIMDKYFGETVPYVNLLSNATYQQVTDKIEELEK